MRGAVDLAVATAENFPPYDTCPCGRGEKAKFCCLQDRRHWRKRPADVRPPGPKTGSQHPKCYAAALDDCSPDVSREHTISRSVLRQLSPNGRVRLSGPPWLNGEARDLPIDAIASSVLCSRHNQAFASLDAEGNRFCAALRDYTNDLSATVDVPDQQFTVLSGEDVERWMAKCLIGLCRGKYFDDCALGFGAVNFIADIAAWTDGAGLYVNGSDPTFTTAPNIGVTPILHGPTRTLVGFHFTIFGIRFVLMLIGADRPHLIGHLHRPWALLLHARQRRRIIYLTYEEPGNLVVGMRYAPTAGSTPGDSDARQVARGMVA